MAFLPRRHDVPYRKVPRPIGSHTFRRVNALLDAPCCIADLFFGYMSLIVVARIG